MTEDELISELHTTRAVRDLRRVYNSVRQQPELLDWLIDNTWDDDVATNCTWLIKCHLSGKGQASARQTDEILELLFCVPTWLCQLHLLQSLPHLQVSQSMKSPLRRHLDEFLLSERKLVRAWTYNALHVLACQFPEYQREVEDLLLESLKTEASSPAARIRALLKQRGIANLASRES